MRRKSLRRSSSDGVDEIAGGETEVLFLDFFIRLSRSDAIYVVFDGRFYNNEWEKTVIRAIKQSLNRLEAVEQAGRGKYKHIHYSGKRFPTEPDCCLRSP